MKRTILLTGAGGVAIPFLITSLRNKGYRVLTADMDGQAAGLFIADKSFVIPAGASLEFLPALRSICLRENVDVFIPLVDEELVAAIELERDGINVILPNIEFVKTCLDKYALMQSLYRAGISVPKTYLLHDAFDYTSCVFPMIIKPRVGRGSRGVCKVNSQEEIEKYLKNTHYTSESLLLQEYILGPEYTVSVVVWRDGNVQAVIPKEIISKRGITRLAVTRYNKLIEDLCILVQEKLHADGPFNVQLCLDDNGQPYIFEINPRFSTSVTLTMAAGIDEVGLLVDQAISGTIPTHKLAWKEGVVLMRSSQDTFVDHGDFIMAQKQIIDCTL